MDATYRAPYFASPSRLPAPLPPPEVIATSGVVLQEFTGRRVVRFNTSYIIKYGLNVSLTEGENMLFLRETQTIPVPEVFALYSRQDAEGGNVKYIIMENILGERLDTCWAGLESWEKTKVATQLRVCLDLLRKIPAPGYFGCIGRRPFEESIFWTPPEDEADRHGQVSGPFNSESELNEALVRKYLYNGGREHKAKFYRRMLPSVLRNHTAVFSHSDVQRKNIILREDRTVMIIDWEAAGWYPEYWEYVIATVAGAAWKDDWHEYIAQILTEYPNEYAWFDMIIREIWS